MFLSWLVALYCLCFVAIKMRLSVVVTRMQQMRYFLRGMNPYVKSVPRILSRIILAHQTCQNLVLARDAINFNIDWFSIQIEQDSSNHLHLLTNYCLTLLDFSFSGCLRGLDFLVHTSNTWFSFHEPSFMQTRQQRKDGKPEKTFNNHNT